MGKAQVEEVVWACDVPYCDKSERVNGHGGLIPDGWAEVIIMRDDRSDGDDSRVLAEFAPSQYVVQRVVCPAHRRQTVDRITVNPRTEVAQ